MLPPNRSLNTSVVIFEFRSTGEILQFSETRVIDTVMSDTICFDDFLIKHLPTWTLIKTLCHDVKQLEVGIHMMECFMRNRNSKKGSGLTITINSLLCSMLMCTVHWWLHPNVSI